MVQPKPVRPVRPINPTTYEIELIGGDKVEIGDREAAEFRPHLKLNRWDGECFIAVKPANLVEEEVEHEVEGDKIKCKYKVKQDDLEFEWETEFYPLEPTAVIAKRKDGSDKPFIQNELGGLEFEITLRTKPPANKVIFNIETQGLRFLYQPPLTQEEIDAGDLQPDNVVGSYAVYHATRSSIHKSKEAAEKYKCGKAFHIYRPKATDARGDWAWCELSVDEGTLTITIGQGFLDSAVYPVVVDPNFGYESIGATTSDTDYRISGSKYPSGGAGTGDYIKAYYSSIVSAWIKCALYDSSRNFVPNGGTVELVMPVANGWLQFNFPVSPTIANADYGIYAWSSMAASLHRDVDAGVDRWWQLLTYNGWPASLAASDRTGKFSIYCSYTEAAAGWTGKISGVTDPAKVMGVDVANIAKVKGVA